MRRSWTVRCGASWRRSWSLDCSTPGGHPNPWTTASISIPPETVNRPPDGGVEHRAAGQPAGVLPLQSVQRIAVVGPCARIRASFFGCYAFPNHVIPQFPEFDQGIGIVAESLLTAVRAEFPAAEVHYELGCQVSGGDLSGVQAAVARRRRPMWWCSPSGTGPGFSGTGHPGKAVTRRTSTCRATSRSWSRRSWRPAADRAAVNFWSPVRTRAIPGSCGGNRAGVLPRRGGRQRMAGVLLAGSIPPASYRLRCRAMRAATRTRTSRRLSGKTGEAQPGSDAGIPVRIRPVLHLVQLRNLHASAVEIDTAGSVELTVTV